MVVRLDDIVYRDGEEKFAFDLSGDTDDDLI